MFKTSNGKVLEIEELTWEEASKLLFPVNHELTKIIDDISPSNDLKLYRVKYPFGARIIHDAETYIPVEDGSYISFNDASLPQDLKDNLSYDINTQSPLGVIVDKKCEFYMHFGQRILPNTIISKGDIVGVSRVLNGVQIANSRYSSKSVSTLWNLNSGTVSSFMLPKISDSIGHNKLKQSLGIVIDKPDSYQEHNAIFTEISAKTKNEWKSDMIFFSKKWFKKLPDPAWVELYSYLSFVNRAASKIWHNTPNWTAIYNEIESEQRMMNLSPYALGTSRHLFTMAVGCTPGFKPATDDSSLPTKLIQDTYMNVYDLADNWPIIMEPTQFTRIKEEPVYYSLNHPTLAQHNPSTYKGKSIISLAEEVSFIMEQYSTGILKSSKSLAPSLYEAAETIEFSFYHNDHSNNRESIKNNAILPTEDPRFICKHKENAAFPTYSPFLKGCIKVALK